MQIIIAVAAMLLSQAPNTSTPPIQVQARIPQGEVRVLHYAKQVFEGRVLRCHLTRRCAPGDYVQGFRLRGDIDGYTSVRWADRRMVGASTVIVADIYSPKCGCYKRQRLLAADWQQRKHATIRQVLEVDAGTAQRLGFYGWRDTRGSWHGEGTTWARVVRYER